MILIPRRASTREAGRIGRDVAEEEPVENATPHNTASTKWPRNMAAVIAPPARGPTFFRSAILDLRDVLGRHIKKLRAASGT